jgi:hypothetical protein
VPTLFRFAKRVDMGSLKTRQILYRMGTVRMVIVGVYFTCQGIPAQDGRETILFKYHQFLLKNTIGGQISPILRIFKRLAPSVLCMFII